MPLHFGAGALDLAQSEAGTVIGFAVGLALAEALRPEATQLGQASWSKDRSLATDPGSAAAIVAENVEEMDWGIHEAAQHGLNETRFRARVNEVLNAPGLPELLRMLRRGTITPDDFLHGMRKAKLEPRWDGAASELQAERLDPAVIATSIQRGIIADPGLLPVGPPTSAGTVAAMPVAQIDAVQEAAASGIDRERLAALTRIVGLPPAPGELLQLLNRGVIEDVDFFRGVSEGNTRNEWGPSLIHLRRRLLTPHEYVELRLRGWIDDAAMHDGAALSGMEQADTDLLHLMVGRPLSFHQVFIGERRGGVYNGPTDQIDPAFLKQLEESNIRPEWYNLAWAQRETLPSAFVIRGLLRDGAIDAQTAESLFLRSGWPADLARLVAGAHAAHAAPVADKHVTRAETHLWTALHKSYVIEETDGAHARGLLDELGVTPDAQPRVLALWDHERALVRKTLTPSQIRKAYHETRLTEEEALARLERAGMNPVDAQLFLEE